MVWEICLERPSASVRSHQFCTNFCQDPRDLRIWGYCWWLRVAPIWPGVFILSNPNIPKQCTKKTGNPQNYSRFVLFDPQKFNFNNSSSINRSKSWPYSFRAFLWEKTWPTCLRDPLPWYSGWTSLTGSSFVVFPKTLRTYTDSKGIPLDKGSRWLIGYFLGRGGGVSLQ